MGKLLGIVGITLLLVILDQLFLGLLPVPPCWGRLDMTELCVDCGMTRSTRGIWVYSGACRWRRSEGSPASTPVSDFLRGLGAPPCELHLWRDYSGTRYYAHYLMASRIGVKKPCAPQGLIQERRLAGLDDALAREAIRARLQVPGFDGGVPPPWFTARGWPPADAGEARSWWAAARPTE